MACGTHTYELVHDVNDVCGAVARRLRAPRVPFSRWKTKKIIIIISSTTRTLVEERQKQRDDTAAAAEGSDLSGEWG